MPLIFGPVCHGPTDIYYTYFFLIGCVWGGVECMGRDSFFFFWFFCCLIVLGSFGGFPLLFSLPGVFFYTHTYIFKKSKMSALKWSISLGLT